MSNMLLQSCVYLQTVDSAKQRLQDPSVALNLSIRLTDIIEMAFTLESL